MKKLFIGSIVLMMLLSIPVSGQTPSSLLNSSSFSRDNAKPVNWNSKGIVNAQTGSEARAINDNWCI